MTEYINKEFYQQIPANERHFIKLSQEAAYAAVKELEAANIPHSATISEYRSIVTVNKADSVTAEKIAENAAKAFPASARTILGNTEYKYIRDKKYIDTDADTARKIAALLSGNVNNRFSGIIRGEKATITVSGEKNAAAVRAMAENFKNLDLLEALRERGFERTADTNGFVNIRNIETGETCGFNGMAAVRDMFDNPENEFFYPLSYRIAYRENPSNGDYYYYVQKYNSADKSSAKAYRDENNKPAIFKSVDEALSYTAKNGIKITNIDEEIANWREVDREREDNSIIEENRKLIENFPIIRDYYIDLVKYNSNTDTFSWIYFNPDGNNGNGEFVDKTVTKEDIFAAYSLRISAENEEQGRNCFIAYLNENCKEDVIPIHSGYFAEYADDYINYASRNFAYYFGISENAAPIMSVDNFISSLETNCDEVKKDKQQREQPQEITESSFRVELDGYAGTWNVIENAEIDGRELFMLENDYYGDSVAYIVADKDGNVVDNNVWGNFEEYENTLVKRRLIEAAENAEDGTTMPVLKEFADDMRRYGFEVSENNGIFTARKEDISSFVRIDIIAEMLYDISEKYRFEPNEAGNNHLLDLNRFYDSYDWESYSEGKNVLENTIIALQSGNFEPIENYIEQVQYVCVTSTSNSMGIDEGKIREAAEHLEKFKAVFVERSKSALEAEEQFPNGELSDEGETAEIPQESNIHFGYFGNGVLCYDTSRLDKKINDYVSVAHISSEGNIRYYVDDLSENDKQSIENHAKDVKDRFIAYWNELPLLTRYGMLYDRLLDTGNVEQIRAFDADHSIADMSEKVKKYEHSIIFRDEDFPVKNSAEMSFQEALDDLIKEKNKEAVEKIEVGGEITLNNEIYVIKNIDGDYSLSMEKKGDSNADIKRYVGNWKEQLLSEAGDNALFVYSAVLANDLDYINAVNSQKSKDTISANADNGEIISDDTDRTDNNVKFLTDNISDLDNETAERLVNAFAASALTGWDSGESQVKINRIKKSLFDILSDEEKTEKAYALISKNVYNHNSDTLDFRFGGNNGREWFTESELLHNFAKNNRNISFALANAVFGYLDEKKHAEREIDELKAGWYDKTDFKIKANIDGELFDYEGRFDIGDGIGTGGGTLVDHIRQRNEYIIKSDKYPYNTKEAKDEARLILDVFVPFLEQNTEMTREEEEKFTDFKENHPIRTSIKKNEKTNDDFEIYQVKRGDKFHFKRFVSLSALGGSPDMSDYSRAYSGKLSEFGITAENKDDILNNIYSEFNLNIPADFLGHSLSVSDIIVLHTDGTETAHYVDDIGFTDVPDFLTEKTREQPHTLSVGDIVTFADRPNVWRVSAINDTQIDFENTDQSSMDKMFSHIDFGQHRDNLQEKLKYSVVSKDISVREINNEDKTANSPMGNYNSEVKENAKATKPKKIPNTVPHRNFNKLKKLFPELMAKNHTYERYENGAYEPLSAEWITDNMISLMQTYVQNGDLMRDPDVTIKVDFENETVNAFSFENSGMGIYQEYSDGSRGQKDTNNFIVEWLNNIELQNLKLTRYDDINDNRVDLTQNSAEVSEVSVLSDEKAYIYSEIKFETGEVYLVPDKISDDNVSETQAYKEILGLYADKDKIDDLDDMIRVNIRNFRYGSGVESIPSDEEIEFIRENSTDVINKSEEIGNTEFFAHFWKNVDDVLNDLESKAAEQHKTSKKVGDGYEEHTYIFPTDYSSDYPNYSGAVTEIKVSGEWFETEKAVKNMNSQGNTDTSQIEALRVRTVSFDGIERSEELSPEAFHIILDRTKKNKDEMKEAAELYEKNDGNIMPVYTKTPSEAAEAGERDIYFAHMRENERCAESMRYSIICNNDGMHFNSDKAISELMSTYSIDRIALIIAARVSEVGEWDRRYSRKNFEWARNVVKDYPAKQVEEIRYFPLNNHPILLNAVLDELRSNFEMFRSMQEEKISETKSADNEQQKFNEDIKNLNQLKKALSVGTEFIITDHRRKDSIGERRVITSVKSTGFYSKNPDMENAKDLWLDWGKAGNWKFENGVCTSSLDNNEMIMSFKVLEEDMFNVDTGEIRRVAAEKEMNGAENAVRSDSVKADDDNSPMGNLGEERHISAAHITIGDKFLYNGNEVTVSSLIGIYPDEIGVSRIEKSGGIEFEVASNVDKFTLAKDGIYLGNAEKSKSEEKAVYTDEPITAEEENSKFDEQKIISAFDKLKANHSFSPDAEKFLERTVKQLILNKFESIDPKMFMSPIFSHHYGTMVRINDKLFDGKFMQLIDEANGYISGNGVNDVQKESLSAEDNSPMGNFEPQINDVVENDEGVYKIENISGNYVTLLEADTLLPDEKLVSMTDFYKSNFTLLERDKIISEAANTEKSLEIAEKTVENVKNSVNKAENYVITNENSGEIGSAKNRYAANIAAINVLKSIEAENRAVAPAEQDILAGYTGWGSDPAGL